MRKRLLAITLAIAAAALSGGCAAHSFRTSGATGTSATAARSAAIVIRYEPQIPSSMSMRTTGMGAVVNPTANDRLAATAYNSPSQDPLAPVLVVKVDAVKGFCSAWGCKATLVMHGGTIRSVQDKGWAFASEVGQASNLSNIDDKIVEAFGKELFGAMERDGVVRGGA